MKTERKLPGNTKPVETGDKTNDTTENVENNMENKKETAKEKRDSTISFRVSKSQREHIESLAKECGMNLSCQLPRKSDCSEVEKMD